MADVLRAIRDLSQSDASQFKISNLAIRSGLPHDRLQLYLEDLAQAELITRDRAPRLTEKGRLVLEHYEALRDVMGRFGLE